MEDTINALYTKETYLDKYGGSLIVTVFTILIAFLLYSYFIISHNINHLRANWNENKCHPSVLPFAGIVNAKPGESKFDYTQANFTECTQSILTYISGEFIKPLYYSTAVTGEMFKGIADDIQSARNIFSNLRDSISQVVDSVLSRFLYALMPIRRDIIKLKSALGKTEGVLTGTLFTSLASFMGLQAFFGAFIEIVVKGLVALAAFIVAMWILPFTWPVAGAATAFFVAIAVPFAIAVAYLKTVIHTNAHVPGKPKRRCFDAHTLIKTNTGEKHISDVVPGEVLANGSIVTGILKCSANDLEMCNLNGIIVSSDHKFIAEDGKLISANNHPDAISLPNYRGTAVYCMNTTTKYIELGNPVIRFLDWDEITDVEMVLIKKQLNEVDYGKDLTQGNIHKYLDGGFIAGTPIELSTGEYIGIEHININDELYGGERVMAIVKVECNSIYEYNIDGVVIRGGPNLMYICNGICIKSTIGTATAIIDSNTNLYHIVTDTDLLMIGGITFCDYNYCIDAFYA